MTNSSTEHLVATKIQSVTRGLFVRNALKSAYQEFSDIVSSIEPNASIEPFCGPKFPSVVSKPSAFAQSQSTKDFLRSSLSHNSQNVGTTSVNQECQANPLVSSITVQCDATPTHVLENSSTQTNFDFIDPMFSSGCYHDEAIKEQSSSRLQIIEDLMSTDDLLSSWRSR
ncbi:hypothetical protein RCL1_001490 [Eukaryota sp. TZLM3-RCL]